MIRTQGPFITGRKEGVSKYLVTIMLGAFIFNSQAVGIDTPEHGKLYTGDASTLDPGKVELEFGFAHRAGTNTNGMTLTVGLADNFDLGSSLKYVWMPGGNRGFGDMTLNARWRFLRFLSETGEVAFGPGVTVPVGNAGVGTGQGFWSWNNALTATVDLAPLTMNYELGLMLPLHKQFGTGIEFSGNGALGWQALDWLQPEIEANYAAGDWTLTAGAIAPLSKLLLVKIGIQKSLTISKAGPDWLFGVKLAF